MTGPIIEARNAGYSDDEILGRLEKTDATQAAKIKEAKAAGYNAQQILDKISGRTRPLGATGAEKTLGQHVKEKGQKLGRYGMQLGLGLIENATLPYDVIVSGSRISRKLQDAAGIPEVPGVIGEKSVTGQAAKAYTTDEMLSKLGEKVGIDTEPQDAVEKFFRLTGLIKGAVRKKVEKETVGAVDKLTNWLKEPAKENAKSLAASAPVAASAVAAEEIGGVPTWATLFGIAGGSAIAPQITKQLGKASEYLGKRFFLFDPTRLELNKDAIKSFKAEVARGPAEAKEQLRKGLITPEKYQEMKPYLDTALEYNIPLTPSTLSDSSRFKQIERMISKNDLTQEAAQKFRQHAANQWGESYQTAIRDMAQNARFSTREGIAEALATDVTRTQHAAMENEYKNLYSQSEALFRKEKPVSKEGMKEIEDSLTNVYRRLGESRIPSSAESSTRNIAQRGAEAFKTEAELISPTAAGRPELEQVRFPTGELQPLAEAQMQESVAAAPGRRTFMQAEATKRRVAEQTKLEQEAAQKQLERVFGPEAKNMTLTSEGRIQFKKTPEAGRPSELVATKRSLNQSINWEYPDIKNLLEGPNRTINDVLAKEYGQTQAHQKLKAADKIYGDSQKLFGQEARWKKWGLRQDALPNELETTMRNLERFKRFEKDFGKTPEGAQLIDYMKRQRVEEMLNPVFVGDIYQPGQVANGLRKINANRQTKAEFEYFTSPKARQNIESLAKLDAQIQRTSSKFYKTEAEQNISDDLRGLLYGFSHPSGWALSFANKVGKDRVASTYAKLYSDPRFTAEMKSIAEDSLKILKSKQPNPDALEMLKDRIKLFWDDIATEINLASGVPSRLIRPAREEE